MLAMLYFIVLPVTFNRQGIHLGFTNCVFIDQDASQSAFAAQLTGREKIQARVAQVISLGRCPRIRNLRKIT